MLDQYDLPAILSVAGIVRGVHCGCEDATAAPSRVVECSRRIHCARRLYRASPIRAFASSEAIRGLHEEHVTVAAELGISELSSASSEEVRILPEGRVLELRDKLAILLFQPLFFDFSQIVGVGQH